MFWGKILSSKYVISISVWIVHTPKEKDITQTTSENSVPKLKPGRSDNCFNENFSLKCTRAHWDTLKRRLVTSYSSNKYNNFVCLCATPNEHTTVEVVTFWCCYWCGDYFNGLVPGGGSGTTLQKQSKLWPVIFPDFPGDNLLLVAKFDLHVSWLGSGFLVVQNLGWWKLAEKVEKLLILTQSDNYLWKVVLNLKKLPFQIK